MPISWNEIRKRAIEFSKEWEKAESEVADKQTFWNEFFEVFGISRKRVATYEKFVNKLGNQKGFIDLFWPNVLIVEHKSANEALDKAYNQSIDYTLGLKEAELPKYVIVSNFQYIRLYDLEEDFQKEFTLKEFYKNIKLFGFIAGYSKVTFEEEDPANIKAAELMGQLHDSLFESGYTGHELEVFLVRILFCLFAEDTGIFEKNRFTELILNKTAEDGSDTGSRLSDLFQVLNTEESKRYSTLDESISEFRYVNGKLFEERIQHPAFNSSMRSCLLKCCSFDWSRISPAVFGSLFQSVMNKELRRNIGAHYTTEKNILKLIKPLFLDELNKEFESIKNNKKKLIEFREKLSELKFLDPACGCGNFLVITYREIRLLELKIIKLLYPDSTQIKAVEFVSQVDVDQFYGIELEEFPAQIAQVAMWLVDHQMNSILSEEFGTYYIRLPLVKSAKIVIGNALRLNWNDVVDYNNIDYILGNPPFVGKAFQTDDQTKDQDLVFHDVDGAGVLDYVACWYIKAAQFINEHSPLLPNSNKQLDNGPAKKCYAAFVSTNSISQGEQVGILWNELFNRYNIKIHFAHRTFKWSSEARGKANVFVVIVGFSNVDKNNKYIFDYDTPSSEPHLLKVKNINGYLVEGNDIVILKRKAQICNANPIIFGNMPNDGGHFLLTDLEKEELLKKEPTAEKFIYPFLSAREYLNNINRWCLWLKDIKPDELRNLPEIKKRVELVKEHRLSSKREATRKLANFPTLFGEIRQPETDYLLIPRHTSENRRFIPFGYFTKNEIIADSCLAIANANLYAFGVMQSSIHMVWIKYVCGRLKGDFRYSNELVYNNFPWPEKVTGKQKILITQKAQKVLVARNKYPESSLADLYDPIAMPPELTKAHQELDKAVDSAYRSQPFANDTQRIEFLFELYAKYIQPLVFEKKKKKRNIGS